MVIRFLRLGVWAAGSLGHSLTVQLGEQPGCLLGDLKMFGQWGAAQRAPLRGGGGAAGSLPPQAPSGYWCDRGLLAQFGSYQGQAG